VLLPNGQRDQINESCSSNQVNYGIAYLTYEKRKGKKRRKKPLYYICQWLTNIWVGGDQGMILPRIAQKQIS
jgi:hypothetical protein